MKKFNLVPKDRVFTENTMEVNPIGFTGDNNVQMYIKTTNAETGKVIYEMNQTIPMDVFILLNDEVANFEAINAFLLNFDVELAPIVLPEPILITTTIQPTSTTTIQPV